MGLREFLGSYGTPFNLPPIAGKYSGGLVLCGDAHCVWDDLERFGCRDDSGSGKVKKDGWQLMTVNKLVEVFPGHVEHCYSNNPHTLLRWVASRRDEYAREFIKPANTHSITPGCDHVWPFGGHGTSGLGAALAAVGLGYERIAICGMPLDDGPHNGEPPWRKCYFASSEAAGGQRTDRNTHWQAAIELAFEGKVKSMSGRTKKWLGDALQWA